VIWRNDGVKRTSHCFHKDSVSRQWASDACLSRGWSENIVILGSESTAVAAMRIQRA